MSLPYYIMSTPTCDICCETFNKSTRHRVECASCDTPICRECVRTYLLGIKEDPHCMSCKNHWDLDILIKTTQKSFVDGKYKQHKKDYLFEHEQSRLPDTMPAVEAYKQSIQLREEQRILQHEIDKCRDVLDRLLGRKHTISNLLWNYKEGTAPKAKVKFMKACPAEDCRGFLSTAWKCGSCDTHTCSKCFAVKVTDVEHVCNEDDVKSAEMIKSDTRSCPGCATPVYKVEGCDQMWCTQCHTAFSYKSGAKINGVIHNPHFYAWQNEGGQAADAVQINAPGAVMCGGIPRVQELVRELVWNLDIRNTFRRYRNGVQENMSYKERIAAKCTDLHRWCGHFANEELEPVRRVCNAANDNEKLRVRYIMKEIDMEQMKQGIMKADRKRGKAHAILQIYELVNTVLTESVRDIFEILQNKHRINDSTYGDESPVEVILRNIKRCDTLREYANTELIRVSVMYSQTVGHINETFGTTSKKYTAADLVI